MTKDYIKIAKATIFLCVLMLTPMIYYTIKAVSGKDSDIMKAINFDLNENRNYSELEYNNIFDFPSAFDSYFNDNMPFRSFFIQSNRNIESVVERPYVLGLEEFLMNVGKKEIKRNQEYKVFDEKYMDYAVKQYNNHALMPWEEDIVSNDKYPLKVIKDVIIGKKNWYFLNSNNIIYYKGTNVLKENQYESYVKKLEDLDALGKRKGKNIIYLMIPEKELIYEEYMPTMDREDTVSRLEHIQNYVASYSNINYIYAKDAFMNAKKYYRVYRKYDTHYNNAGAYVVHNEILKKDNKEYIGIDDVKIDKIPCQNKDLIWMTGQDDSNYMDDFDYEIHYKEDVNVIQIYEDHERAGDVNRWVDIYESDVDNEETLLFYGDSFKENMKKYLSKDYEKSVFMGTLNKKRKEMLENSVQAANVIVIENAGRNEQSVLNSMVYEVTKILNKLPDVNNEGELKVKNIE